MPWLPKSVVCLRYYSRLRFRSDTFAALILALQLFPVAVAIAIASGLQPFYGISCAVIAGFLASALGDSKVRVSAPNIVLVAVAYGVVGREGILSLSFTTLIAGVILVVLGAIGLGAAFKTIPRPVVVGLFSGIAVLVASAQLPELFGIRSQVAADDALSQALIVLRHLNEIKPQAVILAIITLIVLRAGRRTVKYIPTGLIAIVAGALLVRIAHFPVRTVETLYGADLFAVHVPTIGPLRPDLIGTDLAQGFVIAILVAIESLQAITLASSLSGESSNPNGELLVDGAANMACALAGGLPVCGSSSGTIENVRLGAQTPFAGMLQAVFLSMLLFLMTALLRFTPLPVISALILSSVCDMGHWRETSQLIRYTKTEVATSLIIATVTIITTLPIAIASGMFITIFLHARKSQKPAS